MLNSTRLSCGDCDDSCDTCVARTYKNILSEMSYTNLLCHIVFRTKYSQNVISEEHEDKLYRYIWGFIKKHKSVLYRINGMPDHIHLLVQLHPSLAVSDFVKQLKNATNYWMKENREFFPDFESWGRKYFAITYNYKDKDLIINYIKNQKTHHKTEITSEEVRRLSIENNIPIDERYWEDD